MRRLVRNSIGAGVCHLYSTWPGSYLPPGLAHMITQAVIQTTLNDCLDGQEITPVDHTGCYRAGGVS